MLIFQTALQRKPSLELFVLTAAFGRTSVIHLRHKFPLLHGIK